MVWFGRTSPPALEIKGHFLEVTVTPVYSEDYLESQELDNLYLEYPHGIILSLAESLIHRSLPVS